MDTETETETGRSILCLEDEHFIGELYGRALTKAGYKVNIVGDGAKGLEEAQTDKYDLILLDLMLPNLTGIEILRKLRDPSGQSSIKAKVIVTTNLEQREDVRADIEKRADAYLVKAEFTPRQLVDFINKIK